MKSLFEWPDPKPAMCSICKIDAIRSHPNADRLEIAEIKGWKVVIQKDVFKENQFVLYFEIDSILPEEIEKRIFGEDAKIKLHNSRVKTIKIRQVYSQGLICPIELFSDKIKKIKLGDVTEDLGITKYEPKIEKSSGLYVQPQKKKYENQNFNKVRKPNNIKNFKNIFDGKEVVITEKCHGTSFCVGWIQRTKSSFMDRINIFINGEYEFCYRSMSVQLQKRKSLWYGFLKKLGIKKDNNFYEKEIGKDVYSEAVRNYKLKDIIPKGYEITGEIYGSGVQKGYAYGCKDSERKLICFGVRKDGVNIPFENSIEIVCGIGLEYVPVLFQGILTDEVLNNCTNGPSVIDPKTKVREGCVIELKDQVGESIVILKSISEAYLEKDQTDFH